MEEINLECPRCRKLEKKRIHMKPIKRRGGFHKQTKYKCPECGLTIMKKNE